MAGLVPAIHVFACGAKDVDARHKAGHDGEYRCSVIGKRSRAQCAPWRAITYSSRRDTLEQVRRRPGTPIWTLEGALACEPCRGRNRRAPRATPELLSREKRYGGE